MLLLNFAGLSDSRSLLEISELLKENNFAVNNKRRTKKKDLGKKRFIILKIKLQ